MTAPAPSDGDKYLWWQRGAEDNERIHAEKMTAEARELCMLLEDLAKLRSPATALDLLTSAARIYCPHVLKRKYR